MIKRVLLCTVLLVSFVFALNFPLVLEPESPQKAEAWIGTQTQTAKTQVSIVQSTNTSLPHPIPLDQVPTKDNIEDMVRLAVNLVGGMGKFVNGCSLVVIKPNIVELSVSGSGVVTDANVVRAIAKLIFEVNPACHVVIGEAAGGWCPDSSYSHNPSIPVADGFDQAGYRTMVADPIFAGKKIDIVDLNLDSSTVVAVDPPSYARTSYYIPKTLLRASCVIDAPVMKVHVTGITCALKNNIGVLPGLVYGWWKAVGYPYPSNTGLKHTRDLWDEEIVDISSVMKKKIKLVVVDAVVCHEKYKGPDGIAKRRNMIVAGEDMVAVDWAAAQLMGMNPDDIEHITLARIKNLGANDSSSIQILGNTIAQAKAEFIKDPGADGTFGQSNRLWILSGPYSSTDIDHDNLGGEASLWPAPGTGIWTKPYYFFDDYINLASLTPDSNITVYAHTYFSSSRAGAAELWVGSDEDLKVFLNGGQVYRYTGTRTHALPNDIVPITLVHGRNRLLVKAVQKHGTFDFCLNICEPDARTKYHGNRVFDLRFYPDSALTVVAEKTKPCSFYVYVGSNPARSQVRFHIYHPGQKSVRLKIVDADGRVVEAQTWEENSPITYWTWKPGDRLPAGVYFYQISTGAQEQKGKIVLLK
jgi:uncharacterized protein (DUF362 family)